MNNQTRKQNLTKLIIEASNVPGVSGYEAPIAKLIKEKFSPHCDKFLYDNLGSIIGVKKGQPNALKILVDAHMDEIGFMVKQIDKKGFIRLEPLGGWWSHTVLGKRMRVYIDDYKTYYTGVIGSTPPHILTPEKRKRVIPLDEIYLDLGLASADEVKKLGIQVGDPVVKDSKAFQMANPDIICGKSFDNRASVAGLMQLVQEMDEIKTANELYIAGSAQEEVGLRGAKTVAQMINPDIALVLDTTIAFDQPNMPQYDTKLNNGVAITIMDRCAIGHKKLIKYLSELAKKNNIPFTYDLLVIGGTNSGTIHTAHQGIMTVTLSIPTRYIHSHNEICSVNDVLNAVDLIKLFLNNINRQKFDELRFC